MTNASVEKMSAIRHCVHCDADLPPDAPKALCPACLLKLATAPLPDEEIATTLDLEAPAFSSRAVQAVKPLRTFGDYELLDEIARGGMGVVYKARQRSLDRIVAVKMILAGQFASPQTAQRFKSEAIAAAVLQHPHIVAVHEVGVHEGQHFFSMDYVQGQNLAQLVGSHPLPAPQAARYVKLIAEAIHYAHQQGILHRDLKPSNVLIDAATDQPRVTDFGLAKRLDGESSITVTGQVLGSPNFMPPEQASGTRGKVGRHSDVYGLGGILYHLLTARAPFQADSLEAIVTQVISTEPISPRQLNPSVPPDLETICLKCLEKEPARRYQTAQELADELARFLNDEPIHAHPVTRTERAWRWCRRKPVVASLSATTVALVLAVAIGSPIAAYRIDRERGRAKQRLYVADMLLAQQALEQGDLRRLTELVQKYSEHGARYHRGWEWRYLRQFLRSEDLFTLGRYDHGIDTVSFSPDGRLLASGGGPSVKLWDVAARREASLSRPKTGGGGFVQFSPNGKWLAVAESGGPVRVWDTQTLHNTPAFTLQENSGGRIAWSADGALLANIVWGDSVTPGESRFRVWDVESQKEVARADIETAIGLAASPNYERGRALVRGPLSVAFSPKASLVAIGTQHGAIVLWDVAGRATVRSFTPDAGFAGSFVRTVAFSPDGRTLASGGQEHDVRIWSMPDAQPIATLKGHAGEMNSIAFSPDGQTLATASQDQTVKLWDAGTWQLSATLRGHRADVTSVAFAPDGQTLATSSSDGTIKLWSAHPGKTAIPIEHPLTNALYYDLADDGSALLTLNDDSTCSVRDPITGRQTSRFAVPALQVTHGAVVNGGGQVALGSQDGLITVWEATPGRSLLSFKAHDGPVQAITFSADGLLLATAGRRDQTSTQMDLWRAATGERVTSLGHAQALVLKLVFSPSGRRVAATFDDGRAAVWESLTGAPVGSFAGHHGIVFGASLDDSALATAGSDAQVKVWDLTSGRATATLRATVWEFLSCALSPDHKRIAAAGGDGNIRLWDLETQQEIANLRHARSYVDELAWTPDGNSLVSVSSGKVLVWQAPSFEEIDASQVKQPKPPD